MIRKGTMDFVLTKPKESTKGQLAHGSFESQCILVENRSDSVLTESEGSMQVHLACEVSES